MKFDIYDRPEYFRQLARDIAAAPSGGRVLVAAMSFDSREPLIQALLSELAAAARRGVRTTFIIDAFTFLVGDHKLPGPLWYHRDLTRKLPEPYRKHYQALQQLEAAGVQTAIVNRPPRPFWLAQKGRSHIKAAIIGGKYYIGGCNLTSAKQLDIMAAFHGSDSAGWLYDSMLALADAGNSQTAYDGHDRQLQIDDDSRLILDSGKPGQSAILEATYKLIDEAEDHLLFTCQFFPGGNTAKRLLAAHQRGVRVELFFSHPATHQLEAPIHWLYIQRQRARLPKPFFEHMLPRSQPKLHAKVLLSEKAAMLGSHNYVPQGVTLGTAELAMYSSDKRFVNQIEQRTHRLLAGTGG